MFLIRIIIITFIIFLSSINASAGYFCAGKVDEVVVSSSGVVTVLSVEAYGSISGRAICSLKGLWKGVEPSACKGYLSLLLANQKTKSPIRIQYTDQNTCYTQPEWSEASAPFAIYAE